MSEENQYKVSVIIPTYNRAWTLDNAIESAFSQDYKDFEIIVVDDGSTDDTCKILEKYKSRIRIFFQENKGVSVARNIGIENSRGNFIAFLDSDDAWEKDKLSCQINFFKKNPQAMICQTEEIWIRNGRRVNPQKKHQKLSGIIFEKSLHLCIISPSSVMIKKELLESKGVFNKNFPVCEDYDLWLRITHDTPVFLIDRLCSIKKGGHGDQLSHRHSQDKYRIESILDLLRSQVLTLDQTKKAEKVLINKCRIYANGCLKRGKIEEGKYFLTIADFYQFRLLNSF